MGGGGEIGVDELVGLEGGDGCFEFGVGSVDVAAFVKFVLKSREHGHFGVLSFVHKKKCFESCCF